MDLSKKKAGKQKESLIFYKADDTNLSWNEIMSLIHQNAPLKIKKKNK
jgi:hypothetical protein